MVYEKAIFQTKDGRHPRNALPGSWWWTALFFTALTWAFAGASIGVGESTLCIQNLLAERALLFTAAASIVRFKNLKNSVADIFSPAEVELSAHSSLLLPKLLHSSMLICYFLSRRPLPCWHHHPCPLLRCVLLHHLARSPLLHPPPRDHQTRASGVPRRP